MAKSYYVFHRNVLGLAKFSTASPFQLFFLVLLRADEFVVLDFNFLPFCLRTVFPELVNRKFRESSLHSALQGLRELEIIFKILVIWDVQICIITLLVEKTDLSVMAHLK